MTLRVTVFSTGMTLLAFLLLRALGGRDSLSALYYRLARGLFGQTAQEAEGFFYQVLLPNWALILCCVFSLSMVLGFYVAVGRWSGWFEEISRAAHGMKEDVSQAVMLPKELAGVEEKLNDVRISVLERERAAEEKALRMQDLVVYLAHDLKTPLTSVVGYLNLLHDRPELEAEERIRYTGIALEKARRLEELMGEFFDINRMELDTMEKNGQMVSLSVMLEQLADEFWPLFEEKGLTFHSAISQGLRVWGDPDKLMRVFDNILRNAVNYSLPKGTVGLRAFRQGGELVVTVDNEGVEIPEQELSNIFQKFYRLDTARSTQSGGFGLGLAIAKEIVEGHRGTIRAESNGKRVLFTVVFPAR